MSGTRLMVLSYLGVLAVVPALCAVAHPLVRHHRTNGIRLLGAWLVVFVLGFVPSVGLWLSLVGTLVLLLVSARGIVRSLAGERFELFGER